METTEKTTEEILNYNQVKLYESYTEEDISRKLENKKLFGVWGPILKSMITPNMVSVQPITHPVAKQVYYQYKNITTEPGSVPEIHLNVEFTDIAAETRRLKPGTTSTLGAQIDREILGTVLFSTENAGNVIETVSTPQISLASAVQMVHRKSMRGPANWLLGNPETLIELGLLDPVEDVTSKYSGIQETTSKNFSGSIYTDDLFPLNKVLVGRSGTSVLDAGIIWSPFHLVSDASGELRIRHKITMINTNFYYIVNFPHNI